MLGTTNITISQVRNVLGETANSVGRLCTSPQINKHSKFKPVRYPAESTANDPNWWHANYRNRFAGINITTSAAPKVAALGDWVYELPRGDAKPSSEPKIEPFRLGDFRGYDHNATPVIYHTNSDTTLDLAYHNSEIFFCNINVNASGNGLDIMDWAGFIPDLPNCYFGVYVEGPSNSSFVVTSEYKLTDQSGGVEVFVEFPRTGEYKLYFLICNMKIAQGEDWQSKQPEFYALEQLAYANPITVGVRESVIVPLTIEATQISNGYNPNTGIFYNISNYYTGSNNWFKAWDQLIFKCTVTNNTNSANTLYFSDGLKVEFTDVEGNFKQISNPVVYNEAKTQVINNISLSPGKSAVIYIYCAGAVLPPPPITTPAKGTRWDALMEISVKTSNSDWAVTYGYTLQMEYNT